MHVNLTLSVGERAALVGENGSGKSHGARQS
ncbi:ATP-binding cassette domain-containing protein [Arthrobacter sp.]